MKKSVLLILPEFHDITKVIISGFEKQFDVHTIIVKECEYVKNKNLSAYLIALRNKLKSIKFISNVLTNYVYKKLYKTLPTNKKHFDFLVVIKGVYFNSDQIDDINAKKKILYIWDKIDRFEFVLTLLKSFDSVYCYDRIDSYNYNLKHLPMFVSEHCRDIKVHCDFGVVFVGEYTSYRSNLLKSISIILKANNINYSFILVSENLLDNCEFHSTNKVSFEKFIEYIAGAKVVLDLSRNGEECLTERTSYGNLYNKCIYNDSNETFSHWFLKYSAGDADFNSSSNSYVKFDDWLKGIIYDD